MKNGWRLSKRNKAKINGKHNKLRKILKIIDIVAISNVMKLQKNMISIDIYSIKSSEIPLIIFSPLNF